MKTIILFMGLKGSGKTYLGTFTEEKLSIPYLKIENIFLGCMEKYSDLKGVELEKKAYQLVLEDISEWMKKHDVISIDSTGTSSVFSDFFSELKKVYKVILVYVAAPSEICKMRAFNRNKKDQIPVSEEFLDLINREAAKIQLKWDIIWDNSQTKSPDAFINILRSHFT